MKKYFKDLVCKIILYFIWDNLDNIQKNVDWMWIRLNWSINWKIKKMHDEINSKINNKTSRYDDILDRVSKNSVTMWLDISIWKYDSTHIIVLSRIWDKERVEIMTKNFRTMLDVSRFIQRTKTELEVDNNNNIYADTPNNLVF